MQQRVMHADRADVYDDESEDANSLAKYGDLHVTLM